VTYAPDFRLETRRMGTSYCIALAGELDGGAALSLARAFEQAMAVPDAERLILDMEQLSFIDSAGMRAIIEIERSAGNAGTDLVVLPPSDEVVELLRSAGLAERLGVGPQAATGRGGDYRERIDLALAADPSAPGRARSEIRHATQHAREQDAAVAALLVSELVTNAVVHPRDGQAAPIGLRILAADRWLRVEVTDAGTGFDPERPEPRRADSGGRGLLLVDRLASRWGASPVNADGTAFCVWFELDLELDGAEAAALPA
jgi:anti-anti-sigma factor